MTSSIHSIVVVALLGATAHAGPAEDTLAKVQTFYKTAGQLSADFRQTVTVKAFGTTESNDGTLWVTKPVRLRAEYRQSAKPTLKKEFIFDGTYAWYIDHINKSIAKSPANADALPAAVSFLTGGDQLQKEYAVALDTSKTYGDTVLVLTPKAPSASVAKLYFAYNPTDFHISRSVVVDPKGDVNDFALYEAKTKAKASATLFSFDPKSLPTYKLQLPPGTKLAGPGSGSGSAAPKP